MKTCYYAGVKLIVNLKLQPTLEQAKALRATLERANAACNTISAAAWEHKTFKQYDLHKIVYHSVKDSSGLSAQVIVRCIAKVADAYKLDQQKQRQFKKHGSMAYDQRILTFKASESVSIWTVEGRQQIPYVCGEYQRKLLPFRKGESDLIYRKGNFYLNAVCDLEEPPEDIPQNVLGVDMGTINILTDSDGVIYSGKTVETNRSTFAHRRRNLQGKGTRAAPRKLRQLKLKQKNYQRNDNHRISKTIVSKAKGTASAIAVEELKGIRKQLTAQPRKKIQRAQLANWSSFQLRRFIEYKALARRCSGDRR